MISSRLRRWGIGWLFVAISSLAASGLLDAQLAPPLFELRLQAPSYGGAAIADLDGDRRPEILFGTYFNDERVLALRADGRLFWELPSGGGPVDGSVTVADLNGDGRPEVLWGNSATTRFHVADHLGRDLWTRVIGEVLDAPAAVADLDGDGRLEIVLASCGADRGPSGLRAFRSTGGEPLWTAERGGCYQSAPLLFDQDGDAKLDVVVSTWFDNKVRAFSGRNGRLRWEATIGDDTYHAGSFGDLNGDGVADVVLGDYSARVWAIDGRSGAVLWSRPLSGEHYIFGPTAMGDADGDGSLEVFIAGSRLHAFDARGAQRWAVALPGYASRGPVLFDYDGDRRPDVLVACDGPSIEVHSGLDGRLLYRRAFSPAGDADFHPAIADLDADGRNDLFFVYGRGQSDTPHLNWGVAVAIRLAGSDAGWPTYAHDHHHSANYHYPAGEAVNAPRPPPTAPSATARATFSPNPSPSASTTTVEAPTVTTMPAGSATALTPTAIPRPSWAPEASLYLPFLAR